MGSDYFRFDCKVQHTKLLFLICIHRNEIHQVEESRINKPLHTCFVEVRLMNLKKTHYIIFSHFQAFCYETFTATPQNLRVNNI